MCTILCNFCHFIKGESKDKREVLDLSSLAKEIMGMGGTDNSAIAGT